MSEPVSSLLSEASNTDLFSVLYADQTAAVGQARYGVFWHRENSQLNVLLPATLRSEVVKNPHIHRLPQAQPWVLGLVNIRGLLVPVVDFAAWAGLPPSTSRKMIIHIGEGAQSVAWQIEQEPTLLFAKQYRAQHKTNSVSLNSVITQAVHIESINWLDIDYLTWLKNLKTWS